MNAIESIDDLISTLPDWRGKTLANIRRIVHDADPDVTEEWKWRGTPVWSHNGIICLAKPFKDKVKLTFYEGASLPDPDKFFNNELEGNKWRATDLYKDDKINENSLRALVLSAVAFNQSRARAPGNAARNVPRKSAG